jgi:putative membrane protein
MRIATLAATAMAVTVMAFGAQTTGRAAGQSQMADRDKNFVKDVAQASQIEIETSKLAMTKATNPDVKAFATQLVNEHTAASEELTSVVKANSVMWSPDDPAFKAKRHESLKTTAAGAAFDKEYLEDMISDHEKALALFGEETQNGKDAAIKAFADKTLPALQEHLKAARALHQKLFKG